MTTQQKLRIAAALAAVCLSAAPPASAGASTTWYTHEGLGPHGAPMPEGVRESTSGTGTLIFSLKRRHVTPGLVKARCAALGNETVWNGLGEGFSEVDALALSCEPSPSPASDAEVCPRPVVTAEGLPGWAGVTFGTEHPLMLEMQNVAITFACEGAEGELAGVTLTGALVPKEGDADEQCEGMGDDVDNELRFEPTIERTPGIKETSPHLHAGEDELALAGILKVGPKGEGFTVEVSPCASKGLGK